MLQYSAVKALTKKRLFLFFNCQFIISLEVVIQLQENLESSLESLCSHILWLLYPTPEVGMEHIPSNNCVFSGKDEVFVFLHDEHKGPIFPGTI